MKELNIEVFPWEKLLKYRDIERDDLDLLIYYQSLRGSLGIRPNDSAPTLW